MPSYDLYTFKFLKLSPNMFIVVLFESGSEQGSHFIATCYIHSSVFENWTESFKQQAHEVCMRPFPFLSCLEKFLSQNCLDFVPTYMLIHLEPHSSCPNEKISNNWGKEGREKSQQDERRKGRFCTGFMKFYFGGGGENLNFKKVSGQRRIIDYLTPTYIYKDYFWNPSQIWNIYLLLANCCSKMLISVLLGVHGANCTRVYRILSTEGRGGKKALLLSLYRHENKYN